MHCFASLCGVALYTSLHGEKKRQYFSVKMNIFVEKIDAFGTRPEGVSSFFSVFCCRLFSFSVTQVPVARIPQWGLQESATRRDVRPGTWTLAAQRSFSGGVPTK
jgi:hypothetical protein